jgi:CheY-like chemotaxis protein
MKKKILVVDDEKDDLATMGNLLEKEGYMVRTASSGADALELIRDFYF